MSVSTQSDEELETAKTAIQTAIVSLSKIVIERVSGSEDFRPAYQEVMRESLMNLLKIRNELG